MAIGSGQPFFHKPEDAEGVGPYLHTIEKYYRDNRGYFTELDLPEKIQTKNGPRLLYL